MRIYYYLSAYISHRVAGLDTIACLKGLGHTVTTEAEELAGADLAVLHGDPLEYGPLFAKHPLNVLPTVAFCVWENERLTPHYVPHLRLVDFIWTPSRFSCKALAECFDNVSIVPHVVKRRTPSAEDMEYASRVLHGHGAGFRFFSIVDSVNPRKNIQALLAAFSSLRAVMARKPILVLKQYRVDFDLSGIPGVVCISGDLSEGRMAALHLQTDAYVSAHHAEGWGLGLSQAMAYGKPVIATGYSGNMDFMDSGNSFPVPFSLRPVSAEMCRRIPLFTPDMTWANIDQEALVRTMHRVARGEIPPGLLKNAALITKRFGPEQNMERLRTLLERMRHGESAGDCRCNG